MTSPAAAGGGATVVLAGVVAPGAVAVGVVPGSCTPGEVLTGVTAAPPPQPGRTLNKRERTSVKPTRIIKTFFFTFYLLSFLNDLATKNYLLFLILNSHLLSSLMFNTFFGEVSFGVH
jgi:hypothetical protein